MTRKTVKNRLQLSKERQHINRRGRAFWAEIDRDHRISLPAPLGIADKKNNSDKPEPFTNHDHGADFLKNLPLTAKAPFRTTRWALIHQAGSASESERMLALDQLVRQYSPTLIEFVRQAYRTDESQAEEWVQGFMVNRVLARRLIAKAKAERGRFRSFLLQAIKSYVADELRAATAQKRRPPNGFHPIDDVEDSELATPADGGDQNLFDEVFARQIVLDAIQATHEHCLTHDLSDAWSIFFSRIIGPLFEDEQAVTYAELCSELGLESEAVAYNKLATAKSIFRRQFRLLIDEYVVTNREKEEEIDFIKRFLGQ